MCAEIKQGKPIVGVTADAVSKEVTSFIKDAATAGNPEATLAFADLQSALSGQLLAEVGCNAVSKTLDESLMASYPLTGAADVAATYTVEHLGTKITTTFSAELTTSIGDWCAKNTGDTILYTSTNIKTNLLQSTDATEINAGPAISGNFLSCKTGLQVNTEIFTSDLTTVEMTVPADATYSGVTAIDGTTPGARFLQTAAATYNTNVKYFNTETGKYEALLYQPVYEGEYIKIKTNHFSMFAVIAQQVVAPAITDSNSTNTTTAGSEIQAVALFFLAFMMLLF